MGFQVPYTPTALPQNSKPPWGRTQTGNGTDTLIGGPNLRLEGNTGGGVEYDGDDSFIVGAPPGGQVLVELAYFLTPSGSFNLTVDNAPFIEILTGDNIVTVWLTKTGLVAVGAGTTTIPYTGAFHKVRVLAEETTATYEIWLDGKFQTRGTMDNIQVGEIHARFGIRTATGAADISVSSAGAGFSLPTQFIWGTGKSNVMASFNRWLQEHVSTGMETVFHWEFEQAQNPQQFPSVTTEEFGLFNAGSDSFDDFQKVKGADPTPQSPGHSRRNHTIIEINCWADISKDANAKLKVFQMRDRIYYALWNAAKTNDLDQYVLPPIVLYDWTSEQGKRKETGTIMWVPFQEDNAIIERYFLDPERTNLHRYRMLVKVNFYEVSQGLQIAIA